MQNKIRVLVALCLATASARGIIPFNLFEPYDVLVKGQRPMCSAFQFYVGYEGAFHTRGFMGDDDFGMTSSEHTKGNVLQLWQKKQDAIAAFKGAPVESKIGTQAQFLNIDDDNKSHGIFKPCGKMHVPANILFGAQWRLPRNITLAAYIPYRVVELTDVVWREQEDGKLFEDIMTPNLIKTIERIAHINLHGWKRHGFGDLMVQAEYYFHKPQAKPYLRNVGIELRGGVLFPTGLKEDINKLLALSFGNDGGVGILAAARLELWFIHNIKFGIDVQLLHQFGNTQIRRIKTDPAQTDLLFLNKACVFKEPGFNQHFTLFLDKVYWWRGLSTRLAYQYTKHTEDHYFLCAEGFDIDVVNDAESLQEWTTHNLVLDFKYEWCPEPTAWLKPELSLFLKYGFNGKRAILADTLTAKFSVAF
jgi:hypothetical protein